MDKELIEGLSNLSKSLDKISEALSKKEEPKSASVAAIKMGEFEKQIKEISLSITEIKKDTQKVLDQQDTILKILKRKESGRKEEDKKDKKVKDVTSEPTTVKVSRDKSKEKEDRDREDRRIKRSSDKPTTEEIAKEKKSEQDRKKQGLLGGFDTKKIKDGIGIILAIAVGVIAIGLALKIVGKLDFLSVMALALALPLIAIAFSKIAAAFSGQEVEDNKGKKYKFAKFNVRDLPGLMLTMVGMSTAIMVSSFVLSKVKPIGIFQAITSILIAGTFAVLAPNLGKLIMALNKVNIWNALKSVVLLPIVLLGVSTAIMLSSYVLSKVKPIGFFQALTAIMIAGTFAVVSYGLGKLISAFKGINPMTALLASALMPIVLVAVSIAIAMSSWFLSKVRPIGFFQALTAIMIGATFAVISFGIGKIISAFKGVNPAAAILAALVMPILFVALSVSIMISSWFLSKVRPIGFFQAITAIFIAAVFVVLSFGVAKILKAFRGINPATAALAAIAMPVIFTALSIAIMASSFFLSKVKIMGFFQFLTAVGISLLFIVFAFSVKMVVKAIKDVRISDVIKSGVVLTGWALTVLAVGYIISKIPPLNVSQIIKSMIFTALLIPIAYLYKALIKATNSFSVSEVIKSGVKIILMLGILAVSALLVSKMKIDIQKSFQLVVFTIALAITITIMAGVFKVVGKLGLSNIIKGAIAIIAIAATIMISSLLISRGKYNKYPGFRWSLSVALTLGIFGIAAVLLGTQAMNPMFYAGLAVILALAGTIVLTSYILNAGKYNKYPSLAWALGVGASLAGFGIGAVLLGTQVFNPFFYAGLGMIAAVAAVVVGTSYILDAGKYEKYPPISWVLPTILVIGSFGLVAVGLGVVSPLLFLGLPCLAAIAGTIWLIDKVFSSGKFNKYPSKDWVNPSILVIAKFAGIAILLAIALPLIILGGVSILAVAGIIWLIDKVFSKGEYKKWPSDNWINGVTHVISKVSKLLQNVRRELGFGDLILGAIKLLGVIYTIKLMDDVLKKGEFIKFPSARWNDGVSYSIRTFMSLMKDKSFLTVVGEKIGSLLGGGLDDIASVIVKVDKKLSKGEYKNVPTLAWNKGMASALSNVISLMKNNSILSSIGNKIGDMFGGGLTGTAQTVVDIDKILSKGEYKKFPTSAWSSNVLSTLSAFKAAGSGGGGVLSNIASAAGGLISSGLNFVSGLFGSKSTTTAASSKPKSLTEIAEEVKNVSLKISAGNYTKFPAKEWLSSIITTMSSFTGIIKGLSMFSSTGLSQLDKLAKTILSIDKMFESGKFQKYPKPDWVKSISTVFNSFVTLLKGLSSSIVKVLLGVPLLDKVTQSILKIDTDLSKGKFVKYPSDKWVSSITTVYSKFSQLLSSMGKSIVSNTIGLLTINKVTESILKIDTDLSKGKFVKYPSDKWVSSINSVYTNFSKLLGSMGKSIVSNTLGLLGINKITESILKIDADFNKGKFIKYPSDKWVSSINSVYTNFSKLLGSLGKNIISNTFGLLSINKVTESLLKIDTDLSKGKFVKYPSDKWVSSINSVYTNFSNLLSNFGKNIISNTIGLVSIMNITKSILEIDKEFNKGKFVKYPSDKWVSSVFKVYDKFTQLLSSLGKNIITNTLGSVSIKQLTKSILSIDKDLSLGKFTKYPSDKWVTSIFNVYNKFTKLLSSLGKNIIGNTLSILSINQVTKAILSIDRDFSAGKFIKYPSDKWINSVFNVYNKFTELVSKIGKNILSNITGALALKQVTQAILSVDKDFNAGKFVKYPSDKWINSVFNVYNKFTQLLSSIGKNIISNTLGILSITQVSKAIISIDKTFSSGKFVKYPSDKWINSIFNVYTKFSQLLSSAGKNIVGNTLGILSINQVSKAIITVDRYFSSGKFTKYPSEKWVNSISITYTKFSQLLSSIGKNIISNTIGSLSLGQITKSILTVDRNFSSGKFTKYPSEKWMSSISSTFSKFSQLLSTTGKSLISNTLGIVSLSKITKAILGIDRDFNAGKFTKYPSEKWMSSIVSTYNKFTQFLSTVGKNVISNTLGIVAVKQITSSILKLDRDISSGKFTKYPTDKWINSITLTYNKFTQLLSTLGKNIVSNLLGIVSLSKITKSILNVDKDFSRSKFVNYPSMKWVSSVIKSIEQFSKLISGLSKNVIGNLLGIITLNKVVKSILNVDTQFSTGKYLKYPNTKWVNSTIKSISDFASLIKKINSTLGLPSLIIGQTKVKSIVSFILFIDKNLSLGKYTKWPLDNWIKKTTSSIMAFGNLIVDSDKKFSYRSVISGILKDKIIVEFLLWVDKSLARGKYNKWPDKPWIPKTIESILKYGDLAIQSDKRFSWKNLLSGIGKIRLITNTILWVDSVLRKGKYEKWPEKIWLDKTSASILRFGQLAIDVHKKFGMFSLWLGLKKTKMIANTIRDISLALDAGKYVKFPGIEWSTGVPKAIAGFMNLPFKGAFSQLVDKLFGPSEDEKKSQLAKIVDLMLFVDKKFQSGNWQKFPTVNWVNGTILALQKFKNIVSLLSFSSIGDKVSTFFGNRNPLVAAMSNIEKLAICFDKLAKSVKTFQDSIKDLDAEKLASIKSLSSNVILLSLMDPAQFDSMMEKLEERAGVFGDLIKDFDTQKKDEKEGGKAGQVSVNTGAKGAKKVDTNEILIQKLDTMNALLADISSVVGSRGALKTYLTKIKDDINFGSGNLTARSDRRIKNIIKKLGKSDSGINIYLFTYTFDPSTIYQGVIAQELIDTQFESAVKTDKNGFYSVDYSLIDVEFKKTKL